MSNQNDSYSRLYSGNSRCNSSANGNNTHRRPHNKYCGSEQRKQHPGRYNPDERCKTSRSSVPQSKANDDETTAYAVNLQLKPVEMGINPINMAWQPQINGLGAFNRYFGLLSPSKNFGYTLPDIWDGYFHITLAKFCTEYQPDELDEMFGRFHPAIENLPHIPDIVFQSTSIDKISGAGRPRNRNGIDFIVLSIVNNDEIDSFYRNVQPLLEQIRNQTKASDWNLTQLQKLHVTVRKYSNIDFDRDHIPIDRYPIEFRCSHLEIKQTREQAINRYRKSVENATDPYKWWSGVTEINKRCSGCKASVLSETWEGFCPACGQYESISPLWSTANHMPPPPPPLLHP